MRYFILMATLLTISAVSAEDLGEAGDQKILEFVENEVCFSAHSYSLSMTVEKASDHFHDNMQCFFDSASKELTGSLNKSFRSRFQAVHSERELMLVNEDLTGCQSKKTDKILTAKKVISIQKQKKQARGFESGCENEKGTGSLTNPYSSCTVTEAALNELCAYQEYLHFKQNNRSLNQEAKEEGREVVPLNTINYQEENQDFAEAEKTIAQSAVLNAITHYNQFESSYRFELWQTLLYDTYLVTRSKLKIIKTAVDKWPAKFHNAARISDKIVHPKKP